MTLLGIVFFFVLAVNRGWIGPVARVTLGALASVFLVSAGLYVKRRFEGMYHSAVAAVGAGIAGGYMSLVAAKVLYGLVPDWAALVAPGDRRGWRRHRARVGLGADRRPRARRCNTCAGCGRLAGRRAERGRDRVRHARLRGDCDRRRAAALVEAPRRRRRRDPPAGCRAARPGGPDRVGCRRRGGVQLAPLSRRCDSLAGPSSELGAQLALGLPPDSERSPLGRDRPGPVRRQGRGLDDAGGGGRVRRARGLPLPDPAPSRPQRPPPRPCHSR